MRGGRARPRIGGDLLATTIARSSLQARVRRKVPGLFVFAAPRWRNRNTRVPQKHDFPGSNPGWGTRFFCARAKRSRLLFYNLDVANIAPPRVQRADRPRGGAAGFPSSHLAVAQQASARRSGRRGRRFESCRRDHTLVAQWHEEHDATNVEDGSSILSKGSIQDAVTQSAECSLVEREVACSSPAGVAGLYGA
jgi:hypothetical protein